MVLVAPPGANPAEVGSRPVDVDWAEVLAGMRRFCVGGAPCLERWKAFILACISCGRPPPLEDSDGGGPGLRAALTAPSGVDDAVMFDVGGTSEEVRREGILSEGGLGGGLAAW